MVSKNPAEAVGLTDRGVIEPGRRADLVRVRVDDHVPVVRTVWREGTPRRMMVSALIEREQSSALPIRNGAFIAVVGPSGAGKDTLIAYARAALCRRAAGRVRPAGDHPALRRRERGSRHAGRRRLRRSRRRTAPSPSPGRRMACATACPASVDRAIDNGHVAVANVSRGAIAVAARALCQCRRGRDHRLAARSWRRALPARGRESRGEVLARLARTVADRDVRAGRRRARQQRAERGRRRPACRHHPQGDGVCRHVGNGLSFAGR